ncbi:hypothetical protein EKN06_06405 [Croceicoccus ponticola]|uniref:Uncharacterized protein n=1 Tax=Croceicoccus ponticola TaxID=2217664 RepID=A0A437GY22_9SPHN|nr:hypothetical protein [Croceicoccus ponticola]RVQ67577.1 hypothetical protein EKN06_06405 [Croceicoccus ponticola]
MLILKNIVGWIARHFVLWMLLIAAILVFNAWHAGARHDAKADGLEQVAATVETERTTAQRELLALQSRTATASRETLMAERQRRQVDLVSFENQRRSDARRKLSLVTLDTEAVLADQLLELRIAAIGREIAIVDRALAAADARSAAEAAGNELRRAQAPVRAAAQRCVAADRANDAFEAQGALRTISGEMLGQAERLRRAEREACDDYVAAKSRRDEAERALAKAREKAATIAAEAERAATARIAGGEAGLKAAIASEREAAEGSLRGYLQRIWDEWGLAAIVWQALAALLLIVATPYLIRLLFWFVLAPMAERRPAIRIHVPGGVAVPMPPAERSRTSVSVVLEAGEELLVRQDYLQSSAAGGTKHTRWLLDPKHPLSSIASGLYFLTRVRGEGTATTISAVTDPFAEVTLVTLPDGGAAVLHPRALAAVIQPIGRPLLIRSHWRLFSLNAWLTLQLRYFVFHGPARLVIKGGRGIRVEQAGAGRIFGQDQLVGFSADLAYSVTRTETFWPYFLGREQLLKDRVLDGEGMLMIEEAPLAGRRGEGARDGLEGALDAVLKAVGL